MQTVSLFDAKTHLSRIVETLISGKEQEVVIARHGKPVVRVVAIRPLDVSRRIGLAAGQFEVPADIDGANLEIEKLFTGTGGVPHAPAP